jgi:hypothetical protein
MRRVEPDGGEQRCRRLFVLDDDFDRSPPPWNQADVRDAVAANDVTATKNASRQEQPLVERQASLIGLKPTASLETLATRDVEWAEANGKTRK